jgi:hypothetical protein
MPCRRASDLSILKTGSQENHTPVLVLGVPTLLDEITVHDWQVSTGESLGA